jgi:alpha-galactosidase
LNRALRNIPVFSGIMDDVNTICPDAWVMNLTNPMTTLTDAVLRSSVSGRAVGLCHEISGGRSFISYLLGIKPDEPSFKVCSAGINHCIWMLGASFRGESLPPKIRAAAADKELAWSGAKKLLKRNDFENFWKCTAVKRELMRMTGALPLAGDRHTVEFFGHFTNDLKLVPDYWGTCFTTITDRREKWLTRMKKKTLDIAAGMEKMELRCSHEPVAPIIDAITNSHTYHLEAGNLRNIGQIPNLPMGAVVETPCIVTSDGIRPVAVGEMPSAVVAILAGHCHRQQMIVDAALKADRGLALAALISDPMVQDASTASQMLSEMMEATAQWLPQFYTRGLKKRMKPAFKRSDKTAQSSAEADKGDIPDEIAKR